MLSVVDMRVLFEFINCCLAWSGLQSYHSNKPRKLFLETECGVDAPFVDAVSPGVIKEGTYFFVNHNRGKSQSGFK